MKKILLLVFIGSLSFQSQAQKINAGLKAGTNISNFFGSSFDDVSKKALVGYHVGGYLNFSLAGLSIQPELLLSSAGAKLKNSVSNSFENVKLTYITVPVMVKFNLSSGLYAEAGPQVGFKISEDFGDQSIEDFAKGLDLSVGAGLGYQTKSGFGLGARYLLGLSKVGDFDASTGFDNDFKNGIIQVGLFYTIKSGNKK